LKNSFLRFLLFVVPLAASATSVFTIHCAHGAGFPIAFKDTDTAVSCTGGDTTFSSLNGGIRAIGELSFTQAASADQFSTLYTNVESAIKQGPPRESSNGPGGILSITINYQSTVLTEGVARPGFALIQIDLRRTLPGLFYDGSAEIESGLVIPSLGQFGAQVYCTSQSGCLSGYQTRAVPVMLGTPITLSATGSMGNAAGGFDGISQGFDRIAYQFRFVEADGTTPVASALVPEPSAWSLSILSIAVLYGTRRRLTGKVS
jgi:hypothetical protein